MIGHEYEIQYYWECFFYNLKKTRASHISLKTATSSISESNILGPTDFFSDIENLVLFENAMFKDYRFKHKMKIFLLFRSISPLRNACLTHHEQYICLI